MLTSSAGPRYERMFQSTRSVEALRTKVCCANAFYKTCLENLACKRMLAERFLRLSCLPESCGITVLQKYVGDSVLEWFGGRVLYENEGARAVISCDLKGDVPEYSTQSSHRSLLLTCSQRVFVRNNFRHCQVAFYWQKSLYCKVQESAT